MNPTFITFTGLDERTDIGRVREISARYPVEWGVLFSPGRQGSDPRYPDGDGLSRIMWSGVRLSAHLCGAYTRAIMDGTKPVMPPADLGIFNRMQINHAAPNPARIVAFRRGWGAMRCIAQCRGADFPRNTAVDWLFDCSGGRGVAPSAWPPYPGRLVGYAGGIGPENVASVIAAIAADGPYWIDMESRVRTDGWLDLDKCEAVCRAVYAAAPPHPRDAEGAGS